MTFSIKECLIINCLLTIVNNHSFISFEYIWASTDNRSFLFNLKYIYRVTWMVLKISLLFFNLFAFKIKSYLNVCLIFDNSICILPYELHLFCSALRLYNMPCYNCLDLLNWCLFYYTCWTRLKGLRIERNLRHLGSSGL